MCSNDNYYIYLDYKSNKDNNRLPKLKEILNYVSEGEIIDVLPTVQKNQFYSISRFVKWCC